MRNPIRVKHQASTDRPAGVDDPQEPGTETGLNLGTACPLVLIEWVDSRQPVAAWGYLRDFAPVDNCKCASVGWLIYDGADKKVLAPNVGDIESEQSVQVSGAIHIPTCCVTRMSLVVESG